MTMNEKRLAVVTGAARGIGLVTASRFLAEGWQVVLLDIGPGLHDDALFEGRDVAVANDFRDLFGEVLTQHLGVRDLRSIFPGHANDPARHPGIFRG